MTEPMTRTVEDVAKAMHDEITGAATGKPIPWSECDYASQVRLACAVAQTMVWRGEPVRWAS